jgi:Competence protein CoiA-like family
MSNLTLALNLDGDLVSALTAPRHEKYTCLECGGHLHVKRGQQKAAHFAHTSDDLTGCSGESVTHLAAKRLLRKQLQAELTQEGLVKWMQHCSGAQNACRMRSVLPQWHEIQGVWEVREEITHGRYRFDVAVIVAGQTVFGFEVYYRHLVPEEKAADLNVPWLELVAEDILEFKPRVPFRGNLSDQLCPDCKALHKALQERCDRDAKRGEQTKKYVAEVGQVQEAWKDILLAAKKVDEAQRVRRKA